MRTPNSLTLLSHCICQHQKPGGCTTEHTSGHMISLFPKYRTRRTLHLRSAAFRILETGKVLRPRLAPAPLPAPTAFFRLAAGAHAVACQPPPIPLLPDDTVKVDAPLPLLSQYAPRSHQHKFLTSFWKIQPYSRTLCVTHTTYRVLPPIAVLRFVHATPT